MWIDRHLKTHTAQLDLTTSAFQRSYKGAGSYLCAKFLHCSRCSSRDRCRCDLAVSTEQHPGLRASGCTDTSECEPNKRLQDTFHLCCQAGGVRGGMLNTVLHLQFYYLRTKYSNKCVPAPCLNWHENRKTIAWLSSWRKI